MAPPLPSISSAMEDNVTRAIQVYGTGWCALTYRVREYLMHARLTYEFFDIDHDRNADEFVLAATEGQRRFPLVVVEDDVMTVPNGSQCDADRWRETAMT